MKHLGCWDLRKGAISTEPQEGEKGKESDCLLDLEGKSAYDELTSAPQTDSGNR